MSAHLEATEVIEPEEIALDFPSPLARCQAEKLRRQVAPSGAGSKHPQDAIYTGPFVR